MSDPKTTPDSEHAPKELNAEEAVARANEGLADAEAAGREAVAAPAPAAPAPAAPAEPEAAPAPAPAEHVVVEETVTEPAESAAEAREEVVVEETAWYDRPLEDTPGAAEPEAAASVVAADDAVTRSAAADTTATTPAETPASVDDAYVAPADTYVAPAAAQPIFVQAPEPPRPRGNRGAAGAIGLVAAVAFAVLFLGIVVLAGLLFGSFAPDAVVDAVLATLSSWVFWTPVVAFFLGFWFLGAILNRARWAHWVIWGLLVGVVSYGGYILGLLFQAPFWELTASQGRQLLASQAFAPYAIVAFVLGRELTIWFGAWVARRGRRMTELNAEAQREYERTLEAGPQLYQ